MKINKENIKVIKNKLNHTKLHLEAYMLELVKLLQRLWKAILTSDLHKKDKADILRLLIFAITIIVITALFVLNS